MALSSCINRLFRPEPIPKPLFKRNSSRDPAGPPWVVMSMMPHMAWLAVLIVVLFAPAHAHAALDPRSINPIELRLQDWLRLRQDDRRMIMTGFALGWRGAKQPRKFVPAEESAEVAGDLSLKITQLANRGKHNMTRVATVLTRAQILGRLPLIHVSGAAWLSLPVRHRLLMLHAIQAGAYCHKLWRKLGKPRDSATMNKGLANGATAGLRAEVADPALMLSWIAKYSKERIKADVAAEAEAREEAREEAALAGEETEETEEPKETEEVGEEEGEERKKGQATEIAEGWPFMEAVAAATHRMSVN